mgnify:CR=1 FL=1
MVPQTLHVAALTLDALNLLVAAIDKVRVAELGGSVAKVFDLGLEVLDFSVDSFKFDESLFTTTVVFVEVTLSKLLGEGLHFFFELTNLVVVLLGLRSDKRSNFLLDVFSELLEVGPVVKELLGLLDLRFLCGTLGGKQVKGLLKLIKGEHSLVAAFIDLVNSVNNGNERLDLSKILIFGVSSLGRLFHPYLTLLNNAGHILGHGGAAHVVGSCGGRGGERSRVGGSSNGNHLVLVILEEHSD